jgi:hypothetical protein
MAEFIPKAIDLVKQAVSADEAKNYERAKYLYAQSLECVTLFCHQRHT